MLTQQLTNLSEMQGDAASASQELATGTAADTSTAVMAIERARLSMQLASQIRTKGVEALTEVLHTTI
jgi:flagellar hook-basal body complex protein FliE